MLGGTGRPQPPARRREGGGGGESRGPQPPKDIDSRQVGGIRRSVPRRSPRTDPITRPNEHVGAICPPQVYADRSHYTPK